MEISYQFLALQVCILRRNKANNSSTSTHPFLVAIRTLVLGNLFTQIQFAIVDNETNKTIVILFIVFIPNGKIPAQMWRQTHLYCGI